MMFLKENNLANMFHCKGNIDLHSFDNFSILNKFHIQWDIINRDVSLYYHILQDNNFQHKYCHHFFQSKDKGIEANIFSLGDVSSIVEFMGTYQYITEINHLHKNYLDS